MEPVILQVLMLMITHLIISSILVFVINPYMTYRKMKKEGLTANKIIDKVKTEVTDPVIKKVDSKIVSLETTVNERVNDLNVHVANIKEQIDEMDLKSINSQIAFIKEKVDDINIPENIPDMDKITKLIDDMGEQLHASMRTIDENIPAHISTGIRKMQGAIDRAKGVNMQDHQKGMEVAKQVMAEEVQNPTGEATPIMQIVRHFVNVGVKAELINAERPDQILGLTQGIVEGIGMLQSRTQNSTMSQPGGGFLSTPVSPSHGNNMCYR